MGKIWDAIRWACGALDKGAQELESATRQWAEEAEQWSARTRAQLERARQERLAAIRKQRERAGQDADT